MDSNLVVITKEMLEDFVYSERWKDIRKDYSLSDLAIVRTTDIFPTNGIMETRAKAMALLDMDSPYFKCAISDNDSNVNIKFFSYSSTLHCCLNGLVGNHSLGYFSGRNYFVFDKFSNHIGQEEMVSMREEDTYFRDDLVLSNDASICMRLSRYRELLKKEENVDILKRLKIFVYDLGMEDVKDLFPISQQFGDDALFSKLEQTLVNFVLDSLGYPYFSISAHGYTDSDNPSKSAYYMSTFIRNYCKIHRIKQSPHFGSKLFWEDHEIDLNNQKLSAINHYKFVVENSTAKENIKNKMLSYVPFLDYDGCCYSLKNNGRDSLSKDEFETDVKNFIGVIGILEYKKLTLLYNESLVNHRMYLKDSSVKGK